MREGDGVVSERECADAGREDGVCGERGERERGGGRGGKGEREKEGKGCVYVGGRGCVHWCVYVGGRGCVHWCASVCMCVFI